MAEVLGGKTHGVAPGVRLIALANKLETPVGEIDMHPDQLLELHQKNVQIVNLSLGAGEVYKYQHILYDYLPAYKTAVDNDMLLVWATGNDGNKNKHPTVLAGMPANAPELQKGWLAVTAADVSSDGLSVTRPSYANPCSMAQNWCLAAPGTMTSKITGLTSDGTSFAAPAVTGAAALVKQAHPWMNGDMLRQTILSTATDLGDPDQFGWGMLNVEKAIKGPALFSTQLIMDKTNPRSVTTIVGLGQDSDFSNNIIGNAGLIKKGSGMLTLSGTNIYEGDTHIHEGTLNITRWSRSQMHVENQGTLRSGDGSIASTVNGIHNKGIVQVANTGLQVTDDYTASANATLETQMHAPFNIGGKAELGGSKLVVTPKAGHDTFAFLPTLQGVSTKILEAEKGVSGTFSDMNFKNNNGKLVQSGDEIFINKQLNYNPNDVTLAVTRNDMAIVAAQNFAQDATRINAAENLEQVMRVADHLVDTG
ncbi:MAG: S8 family serine peptidase, partial [Glaciimonas sp.]|nr:S8 family serine peptidase [Glaciimonas sp.]